MQNPFTAYMQLNRRDRMIYGIAMAAMVVMLSGGLVDIIRHRSAQAWVQIVMGVMAGLLFVYYIFRKNYKFFVYAGITIVIIGYDLLLYFDHFVLHSYLILMVIPLVIFFILPLRQALMVSIVHYLLLAVISYYGYYVLNIHSEIFEKDALQVYIFGSLFIMAFGSIYQLAIEDSYTQLKHANTQKALLLKEIHHRIKNNLNKMSSALGLQILRARSGHCEDAEEILRKNKLRIEAMALVHEALYHSRDISNISIKEYITELIELIGRSYERKIEATIHAHDISISLDTLLRIGTILNELYTNTIKHTAAKNTHVTVDVRFGKTEGVCTLVYTQREDGVTINSEKIMSSNGLGMMLVKLSAEEMGGKFDIRSGVGKLEFLIHFMC